jgi:hypothetical protein
MTIKYVDVKTDTEGLFRTQAVNYSNIGMVGKKTSSGSASIGDVDKVLSPNQGEDLYGADSALSNSIDIAFQNGATVIYATPADVSVETLGETFSGDASTTEFTLANQPAQPLESVEVDSTPQVEGSDFKVDYGNKKIIFFTAPASGTDNISVDYNQHSATDIQDALALLNQKPINIEVGAMINDEILLEDIYDHVVAQTEIERIGVYMLKNGETATSFADTIADAKSILIAHKSELKDVASAFAGRIAGIVPWGSLTGQPLLGIQQGDRQFTETERQAFEDKQINVSTEAIKRPGSGEVVDIGTTLDPEAKLVYIDLIRNALFVGDVLETGLDRPDIIGKLPINLVGMKELDVKAAAVLNPWKRAGSFQRFTLINKARELFENPTPENLPERQALQSSRELKDPYDYGVEIVVNQYVIRIFIKLSLVGG